MNEQCEQEERSVLTWLDGRLVIVGPRARVLHTLVVGDLLDLSISGSFRRVRVCSGGYNGFYYQEIETGARGRFATSMGARLVTPVEDDEEETVIVVVSYTVETLQAGFGPAPVVPSVVVIPVLPSPVLAGAGGADRDVQGGLQ
jgi:hypothetical protein